MSLSDADFDKMIKQKSQLSRTLPDDSIPSQTDFDSLTLTSSDDLLEVNDVKKDQDFDQIKTNKNTFIPSIEFELSLKNFANLHEKNSDIENGGIFIKLNSDGNGLPTITESIDSKDLTVSKIIPINLPNSKSIEILNDIKKPSENCEISGICKEENISDKTGLSSSERTKSIKNKNKKGSIYITDVYWSSSYKIEINYLLILLSILLSISYNSNIDL